MGKSTMKLGEWWENSQLICNSNIIVWNLAYKTKKEPGTIVDKTGIQCIVKAMQSNIESGDLLEVACGAIWSLVDSSVERKQDVVDSGAIDAVACAFLVHPERISILENEENEEEMDE